MGRLTSISAVQPAGRAAPECIERGWLATPDVPPGRLGTVVAEVSGPAYRS